MLNVDKLLPLGRGLAPALVKRAASLELDWGQRRQSRFEASDSQGRWLKVALAPGQVLRDGDVLVAEDGSLVRVQAAVQTVLVVRGTPQDLLRAAYHLGGRHVALEVGPEALRLAPDPAPAEWLRAMGLALSEAQAPFEPEAMHGHTPGHGPAHDPAPRGRPVGIAVKAAPHVHGPGCGHHHHS